MLKKIHFILELINRIKENKLFEWIFLEEICW